MINKDNIECKMKMFEFEQRTYYDEDFYEGDTMVKRTPIRFDYPECYRAGMYRNEPECWTCNIHKMCKKKKLGLMDESEIFVEEDE